MALPLNNSPNIFLMQMSCFIFDGLIGQAAGALAAGIGIALLLVALLFFVVNIIAERGRFTIAGYAVGVVLFLFLCYHLIPACGAVVLQWKCDEIELWLSQNVIDRMDRSGISELTPEESSKIVDALVENVPFLSDYVNELQLVGISASDATSAVAEKIRSGLRSFVLKSALWSFIGLIVASVVIYNTMKFSASRSRQQMPEPGRDNRRLPTAGRRRRVVSSGGGGSLRRR